MTRYSLAALATHPSVGAAEARARGELTQDWIRTNLESLP